MPDRETDMASVNNDDQLNRYRELCEAHAQLTRELSHELRPNWQIYLGKMSIPVRLNSTGFSWLYVGINVFAFAFGIACIFLGASWRELGIALIVGAMFGMGTFVGQLLSVQLGVEEHQQDLLWRDALVLKYAPRFAEINENIRAIINETREE